MKTIYCILGRTAAGKSFLAEKICEKYGLAQVKSYTTRPPRPSEISSGRSDHLFVSKEEMKKMREDMAAYTKIGDAEYCTTFSVLENSDVYVIDPRGIKELKEKVKKRGEDFRIVEIYVRAPKEIRKERYESRGGSDFDARNAAEDSQFLFYEKEGSPDIVMDNIGNADSEAEILFSKMQKIS